MPEANIPLLDKVLEHIETHPREWRQNIWVTTYYGRQAQGHIEEHEVRGEETKCGTAFCFAGHAAYMVGATPTWEPVTQEYSNTHMTDVDGSTEFTHVIATRALGLDDQTAAALYAPGNTLADLRHVVAYVKRGAELSD